MIRINLIKPRITIATPKRPPTIGPSQQRVESWATNIGGIHNPRSFMIGRPSQDQDLEISRKKLSEVLRENGYRDISLVVQAFSLFKNLPTSQQERNLNIAFLLAEWKVSPATVAASLLLGTENIASLGTEVKKVLQNRNQLSSFSCKFELERQVDYFRSLLFVTAESHETLLLLAAEDLVDLRPLAEGRENSTTPAKEKAKRAFYATSWILKYLGFGEEAGELEDLAFLHLDPQAYQHIEALQRKTAGVDRTQALLKLKEIAQNLGETLKLPHQIKYRVKRTSSAARRMGKKGNIQDIHGIRIILETNDPDLCYLTYDQVREHLERDFLFEEIKEEFDDYISRPRPTGYQSLHALFKDIIDNYPLEIQIRTREMDFEAEYGRCSHAHYKTGEKTDLVIDGISIPRQRFRAKQDSIRKEGAYFIYDEDGDLHKLVTADQTQKPTILDFAFALGINTGLYLVRGKINGKNSPLRQTLESGQTVFVETGSTPQIHGRLKYANTPWARAILQTASRGTIDFQQPLGRDQLTRKGQSLFNNFLNSFQKEMIERYGRIFSLGPPEVKFSLRRLTRKKGFSEDENFFIALALLEKNEREALLLRAKKRLEAEPIMVAAKIQAKTAQLEILTANIPGVALEIFKFFKKYKIKIISMELNPVRGSNFIIFKFKVSTHSQEEFNQFLSDVENLYKEIPPPTSQFGKTINIELRIRQSAQKLEAIEQVLREIFNLGANIVRADIPETQPEKDYLIQFSIQLPPGGKGKKVSEILGKKLSQLKEIGSIVFIM